MGLKLEDEVKFGKHKGVTFRELVKIDSQYLNWALENIDWLEVDDEVLEALSEYQFNELLKCPVCKTTYKKLDDSNYELACECGGDKNLHISIV